MSGVQLNRRLVLEAPERVADGAGGFSETWQELGVLWGALRPGSGRQSDGETGAVSVAAFKITLRAVPAGHPARPQAGQRLRMGVRRFRIEAVTEVEPRGIYLSCACQEEIAA